MEELIKALQKIAPMSQELIDHLYQIVQPERHKRKEMILREGGIGRKVWFIEKGLIHIFRHVGDTRVTNWILKEGDFMVAVGFFTREMTPDNIETIESVELWYITLEELEATCKEFPEFYDHYHRIDAKYRTIESRRATLLRPPEAYHRFEEFMNTEGDFGATRTQAYPA